MRDLNIATVTGTESISWNTITFQIIGYIRTKYKGCLKNHFIRNWFSNFYCNIIEHAQFFLCANLLRKKWKLKRFFFLSPHKLISGKSRHTSEEFKFSVLHFARLKTVVNCCHFLDIDILATPQKPAHLNKALVFSIPTLAGIGGRIKMFKPWEGVVNSASNLMGFDRHRLFKLLLYEWLS